MNDLYPQPDAVLAALTQGMAAQLRHWRSAVQAPGLRLGWKLGFSDLAARQRAGLTAPVVGHLRRDRMLAPGGVFHVPAGAVIKAEVEVAVRLGRDVAAGPTLVEAEQAIAAHAPAIELVDVSLPLEGFEALLSGNLYHAAVLIGRERPGVPADPRLTLGACLRVNGRAVRASETERLPASFGEFVQAVADTLGAHGERLIAGDWIICGSVVEPWTVSPGDRIEIDMTGFDVQRLSVD